MSKIVARHRAIRALEFVCPRCGLDRPGAEVTSRRWWHLAGMPVVPLGDLEFGVVCGACTQRYDIDILEIPTTAELATVLEAATVAAAIALVRATADDAEDFVRGRATEMLTDNGYNYDDERMVLAVETGRADVGAAQIRRLRDELTPFGKQGLLHRLTSVVTNGAPITTAHRDVLVGVGRQLGVGALHVNGMAAVAGVPADA